MTVARLHANTCVYVRLSPWAPDCIDLPLSDPRLYRAYWSTPLAKVVASLLRRLGRAPGEVTLDELADGDIAFIGPVPPEHDPYGYRTGILAVLWGDVTATEVFAEMDRLVAAGWKPGAWSPPRKAGEIVAFPKTPRPNPSKQGDPA